MKKRILLWSCFAFFAVACHENGHDIAVDGSGEETAQITLALRNNMQVHEMLLTRAVDQPETGDFMVRLENTRAEVLRVWRYDTIPSVIRVVPGSYKLVAYYGDGDGLPAFDTPFYYGETKATLQQGECLDTVVHTSVATVKVALSFDESFDFDYDDYFVEVKTVGDSLHFAKDEKREGYFLPGHLRMRFGLKPKGQDKYYEFYPEAIRDVKAAEFYRMTLKAQSENGALSRISIITDTTVIHIPVNVDLPSFMLPKAPPKVTVEADMTEKGNIVALEGEKKNATALITSSGGLTELKIKAGGAAQQQGWPAEIDLMNADEAVLNDLRTKGLEWDEKISKEEVIKSLVWVRFDNAIARLTAANLSPVSSEFSICATDCFGQMTENTIHLETHPVLFAELPTDANIWAKRAEMKLKNGAAEETYVEYKAVGGNWQRATLEEINRQPGMTDCWVKNLNPNQEYTFRVCVGDYKSIQEFTFTTEEAAQIPNSGFEEWYYSRPKDVKYWEVYYVCREGEIPVWNTMNQLTTSEGGTKTTWTNRNGCRYSANSGTIQTTDAKGGSYAALVRTVGWGGGNSANAISGKMGTCEHVTAGELYLGSYDVDSKKGVYGYDFTSRPLKLSFFYKYVPKNSADWFEATIVVKDKAGEVIAEKTVSKSGGINVYTQEIIELDYRVMKRAASMYVLFKSTGNSACLEANTTNLIPPPGTNLSNGEYLGSQLYIDDIELIYE